MKIPYKIRTTYAAIKTLIMWMPFILANPQRIKFFPEWILSFWPGRAAYKDGLPWITFEARDWLGSFLTGDMRVFEWGSGGSTLFLVKRVKNLISLEHNPEWYEKIGPLIKEKGFSNCQYILKEPKPGSNYLSSSKRYAGLSFEEYCRAIDSYPDNFFDLVLVDGRARNFCVYLAMKKVRSKGFIFVDDTHGSGYTEGMEALKNWQRKDFRGPKPYVRNFYQTTVWQKPALS